MLGLKTKTHTIVDEAKLMKFPQHDVEPEEISAVVRRLDNRGWVNLDTLSRDLGFSRRRLQKIAHASYGEIISGQKGYCLHAQASLEECEHAANWLDSQANDMKARASAIRQKTSLRSFRSGTEQKLLAF